MKFSEFGAAYNDHPIPQPRPGDIRWRSLRPDIEAAFVPARAWNVRLGRIVLNYLLDAPGRDPEKAADTLEEYQEWAHEWIPEMRDVVYDASAHEELPAKYITEMSFHHIAAAVLPQFQTINGHNEGYEDESLSAAQTRLAVTSAELVRQRQKAQALNEDRPRDDGPFGALTGVITEVDTAVGSLETARQHPEKALVVLPASRQFELLSYRRNIDQIFLDADARQARGTQAKTRISGTLQAAQMAAKYDERFVAVIDGYGDLHNYRTIRRDGSTVNITEPGLVSMHHLVRTPVSAIPENTRLAAILKQAGRMTKGHRWGVPAAGRKIGAKVMPASSQD